MSWQKSRRAKNFFEADKINPPKSQVFTTAAGLRKVHNVNHLTISMTIYMSPKNTISRPPQNDPTKKHHATNACNLGGESSPTCPIPHPNQGLNFPPGCPNAACMMRHMPGTRMKKSHEISKSRLYKLKFSLGSHELI